MAFVNTYLSPFNLSSLRIEPGGLYPCGHLAASAMYHSSLVQPCGFKGIFVLTCSIGTRLSLSNSLSSSFIASYPLTQLLYEKHDLKQKDHCVCKNKQKPQKPQQIFKTLKTHIFLLKMLLICIW